MPANHQHVNMVIVSVQTAFSVAVDSVLFVVCQTVRHCELVIIFYFGLFSQNNLEDRGHMRHRAAGNMLQLRKLMFC